MMHLKENTRYLFIHQRKLVELQVVYSGSQQYYLCDIFDRENNKVYQKWIRKENFEENQGDTDFDWEWYLEEELPQNFLREQKLKRILKDEI